MSELRSTVLVESKIIFKYMGMRKKLDEQKVLEQLHWVTDKRDNEAEKQPLEFKFLQTESDFRTHVSQDYYSLCFSVLSTLMELFHLHSPGNRKN